MKKLAYKNVTPEVYEQLKKELNAFGVAIAGDAGSISAKGIKGRFSRDTANDMLEIVIEKTPMLVPSSMIAGQITNAVTRLGGEVA